MCSLVSRAMQIFWEVNDGKKEGAQITPKLKSYLLYHVQGFQKYNSYKKITTGCG